MLQKLTALFTKYREIILYAFFGGLTTLVNIFTYALLTRLCSIHEIPATILALLLSILFAYLTNRKWVFQSKASGFAAVSYEVLTFFGGRAVSSLLDIGLMFLFVTTLHYNDIAVKILSNILVIILNYLISKLVVFRKKKPEQHIK